MSVAAIILAAGASSRLGEPKQLLRFQNETLLARSIRLAAESGADPILAVVGAHWERIRKSVQFTPAIPAVNPQWKQGIASSLQVGLHALVAESPSSEGVLLMTCDQPYLSSAYLRSLLESFRAHHAQRIIASGYAGTVGTPAVFPQAMYARLRSLQGDQGARVVLAEERDTLVCILLEHGEIDIDYPADKARLL